MAGTKYESKIGQIPCNDQVIFAVLSNLENLKRFEEAIPKDKIKDLEITADYVRIQVDKKEQSITSHLQIVFLHQFV